MKEKIASVYKYAKGIIGISIVTMVLAGGVWSFFLHGRYCDITEYPWYMLYIPFLFMFFILLVAVLLYHVNKVLWNKVHESKQSETKSPLKLLPDLYAIADFVQFIGKGGE